jgi:hypothetical protein
MKCGIKVKYKKTGESERAKKTSKALRLRVGGGKFQCSPHHVYVNVGESNQLHD